MAFNNEYTLNVDIKKRMANVVPIFRQGDTAKLNFRVYDNGILFDLTGYTRSEITFRLPSGETLINNCILDQGIITYNFIGPEMAEVGDVSVILSVISGTTVASVQPFTIHIYDNMRHDTLSYISILQDLIQQVQYLELEVRPLIDEVEQLRDELQQLELDISNAEAIRVANEIIRVDSENTRISNEQTRVSSEQDRLQAEGTRLINESNRVNSENLRVIAEQARVNAENLRIQGSQERFEHFDAIIDDFDFKGAYNANTQYYKFNNVLYQGSTFTALKPVIGITPTDDGINWTLSARRGTDGQGAVGSVNGFLPDLDGNVEIPIAEVVDNFESHDTTRALSANKGRELKVLVDNKVLASETQPTNQTLNDMWFDISDTAIDSIDIENAVVSNTPPINQNLLWFEESEQGNITIKKFINGQWLKLNPHTTMSQVEDLIPTLLNKANASDLDTLASIISNLNIQLNNVTNTVGANTNKIAEVELNLNQLIAKKGQPNGYASLNTNGKVPNSQLDIVDGTTSVKGIVQLNSSTNSTSITQASTPSAVKTANDRANSAYDLAQQAFTQANDIKTKVANVIGSPLSPSDTSDQMVTKIQGTKDTFASNLRNLNVYAEGTETLNNLTYKVSTVQPKARKLTYNLQSSNSTLGFNSVSGNSESLYYVEYSNLPFVPKKVIIKRVEGNVRYLSQYDVDSYNSNCLCSRYTLNTTSSIMSILSVVGNLVISQNLIRIPVQGSASTFEVIIEE